MRIKKIWGRKGKITLRKSKNAMRLEIYLNSIGGPRKYTAIQIDRPAQELMRDFISIPGSMKIEIERLYKTLKTNRIV